jgi:parallel beta-helix repeat protein
VVELANGQKKGFSATFTVGNVAQPVAGQALVTTTTAVAPPTTARPMTTTTAALRQTTASAAPSANRPAGSIEIRPGDNVAAEVQDAAKGATFFFQPGTYTGISLQPKSGQTFMAAAGVVLKGNGKPFAFSSGNPNVTIKGFEITGYEPSSRNGVIMPVNAGSGWLIENNEIHHNGETGVKLRNGTEVIGNNIHHNARYGIAGSGSDVRILDNEIAYNATDGASGDSSGTKFTHTEGLVLRGNYVHHNNGNGLWVDIDNVNALIESNTVNSNGWTGIFLEISCGGTIRNNRLDGNGVGERWPNWMSDGGIIVSNTPNVSVTGNRLSGNAKGIGAIHWDHGNVDAVTHCEPQLKNLRVTGNTIAQNGGAAAGIDAKINLDQVWSSWGNSFSGNTYSGSARFRWEGGWITSTEWNAQGLN